MDNEQIKAEIDKLELSIKKTKDNINDLHKASLKYSAGVLILNTFLIGFSLACILTHRD